MNPDDVKFIDEQVTEFRNRLLKIQYLARTNKTQRRSLAEAFSVVLSLPALAREKAAADAEKQLDADCQAMSDLARSERT